MPRYSSFSAGNSVDVIMHDLIFLKLFFKCCALYGALEEIRSAE
ncbi:hypothetical protein ATPR_2126 [Acetobacter tropicalis NBRC 101654]|uniref:Uncharacterized protein n=1 Tax=Acetobacter tropicalis NBRC 101654 TaxID=749388 RepID=F7VFH7_9PROT|nr:hypothetical protein ATPR_2126 [Acetobacter tropicalis NBRC 101654]